ncbi:MAG: glycogen synthase GlgA [Janthinobacterium lividum]
MRVLQVSAELFPFLKTGGLADVAGALPPALATVGLEVRVLLPGFPAVLAGLRNAQAVATVEAPWGGHAVLLRGCFDTGAANAAGPLQAYVIEAPALYDRTGNPYEDAARQPYGDNHRRFALLGWVAAEIARGLDASWQPEVVHAHDWHAGLAPAYMAFADWRGAPRAASVFTVHNLAYQGVFPAHDFAGLGLPDAAFRMDGLEYHGQLSFMKAGLYFADRLTTVSPTYACEIQTPEQGCGLDGLLRGRAGVLDGILNGVDGTVWNPGTDTLLPHPYDVRRPGGKALCKASLQQDLGLASEPDAPLFVMVSRLAEQKGPQLLLDGLDALVAQGGQLALLGSGERWLEDTFRERAAAAPQSVSATIGYDERFAHRLFGAGDVTLVPSRYEPCGLTQMYGLRYGCLPLVRSVGGLADTVFDCSLENIADGSASGFVFDDFDAPGFARVVRRAFALYRRPADWRRVRASAMRQSADWQAAALKYAAVYERALASA